MSTEWNRIKQIFQEAAELDPKDRHSYVLKASNGDEKLLNEVESLFSEDEKDDFLEPPIQVPDSLDRTKPAVAPQGNRFTPGTLLKDRYRITSFIGQGGMGEVYRADDLRLGQTVALKFLPKTLHPDPLFKERFSSEVRIARQLSHPNICRVYDIAEFGGQSFLTMEFVDGEDLKSLIKRIGYLPNEKALDIARQLCAGLAAAHQSGVLHRDLKPGNIMIDGRGRVRIMDFGLAIRTEDATQTHEEIGTPAYMAPELFAGKAASIQSDIYALGLVLYEVYCGKRAFQGFSRTEIREEKERHSLLRPSDIRADADPVVERLILRCIDPDPHLRPESVMRLASALPGGDPMAAAIAAGETPSPEMVAASGEKTGLRFSVAVALLVIVCIGSLVATQLVSQLSLMQRVPLGKSRDVLIERAKEIIEAAGYPPGTDTAFGFDYEMELIQYFRKPPYSDNRWKKLEGLNPVRFWYRQSPHALEHRIIDTASPRSVEVISRLTPSNAPLEYAGEIFVGLDSSGRLREFKAIPLQDQSSIASAPGLDWSQLLSKAGVDAVRWGSVKPETIPLYYADERTAYQGTFATAPDIPMRIEAASYGGRLVSFEVSGPWNVQERRSAPRPTSESVANAVVVLFISVCLLGGSVFARRNLRLGRGDRRAATRLSLFVFSSISVSWLFAEHHVGTLWELYLFVFGFLGFALFLSGVIWILYIAFEPFVRRRWPQVLVAWTRVMSKQWRDPVVGGHMLVGSAVGVCLACAFGLMSVAPTWFGHPAGNRILLSTLFPLAGAGSFISVLVYLPTVALGTAVDILFFLYLLRIIFKNELIATILMTLAFGATILPSDEAWLAVPAALVITAVFLFVLNRLGLLALVVAYFVYLLFVTFPMTLDASNWYFGTSFAALLVVLTIALYGFRISIGNRALLDFVRAEN